MYYFHTRTPTFLLLLLLLLWGKGEGFCGCFGFQRASGWLRGVDLALDAAHEACPSLRARSGMSLRNAKTHTRTRAERVRQIGARAAEDLVKYTTARRCTPQLMEPNCVFVCGGGVVVVLCSSTTAN
ncbi:putative syntaxin [Trypanosoma cruzi]|nr:putative syntaxin [Trypanosoma cruzi]